MFERSFKSYPLQQLVRKWEYIVPLLLTVHGTALLLTHNATMSQWLLIVATFAIAIWTYLTSTGSSHRTFVRMTAIFVIAVMLIATTGGNNSYFLFWLVILILIYPAILTIQQAILLWTAVPTAYIMLYLLVPSTMPLIVVLARMVLFASIGGLGIILKKTISRYLAERKQVEDVLIRSERYFRALIEHALDIITVLNSDGTIRYISPSVEAILGYSVDELQTLDLTQIIHPEDVYKIYDYTCDNSKSQLKTTAVEARFLHKDGSWRLLEIICTDLRHDVAVEGIVLNARNITERKQLEEQIRQVQKMEAIGQFTTGIAHDFSNLLIPIQGFAELMALRLPENDPNQAMLEKILFSTQRATSLIRHLLAFSRKQVVELQKLNLNQIVADMDKIWERILGENIVLQTVLAPDLWDIMADPTQIEQVIVNLAANARDAMPNGGQLFIETKNITLDDPQMARQWQIPCGEYVSLALRDTGEGMAEDVRQHIFEPFFTTKRPGKGTGMGLATVYGIVKQNDGTIIVESQPNAGSTFRILLPRAVNAAHTESQPYRSDIALPTGHETILLVEDDSSVRDFIKQVLQAQGYDLLHAADGEEALKLAKQRAEPIHLLLTDVIMPGISGKILAEKISTLHTEAKILFMSGYDDDSIAHHGILDEEFSLLPKPFGPAELAHKVRDTLDI